jgi:small subunit ribosomal protein S21
MTKPMTSVSARRGESPEQLLKRFRKQVQRSGVLKAARRKRWYVKPSDERRIKKRKAIRKARRRQRKIEARLKRRRY